MPSVQVERVIFPQQSNQPPVIDEVKQHRSSSNYIDTARAFGPKATGKVPSDKWRDVEVKASRR